MNMKKTTLAAAVGLVFGGAAFSANAALTSSATLSFVLGTVDVDNSCKYGTTPPCNNKSYNVSDIVGSYFVMDTNGNGPESFEKTPISSFNGIHLGSIQAAGNSHDGSINGTELPNIDNAWTFFGGTGMHQTTSAITVADVNADFLSAQSIDFSGWNVNWNGIASIPLVGTATIICDTTSCSDSSNYTIDGAFHIAGAGFTTVGYFLHLEGSVGTHIPVPAAAWLFGSGLLGLVGVARRRQSKKA